MSNARRLTHAQWMAEGNARFGGASSWAFVCPSCGRVQTVFELMQAKVPQASWGFSCIGRWLEKASAAFSGEPGPCNYAGGGLITVNPVEVLLDNGKVIGVFEWGPAAAEAPSSLIRSGG